MSAPVVLPSGNAVAADAIESVAIQDAQVAVNIKGGTAFYEGHITDLEDETRELRDSIIEAWREALS